MHRSDRSSTRRPPYRPLSARLSIALLLAVVAAAIAADATAAPASTQRVSEEVRAWRLAHEAQILGELVDLLALPNVASDEAAIRANAAHLVAMLERRGATARLLEVEGSPPAVFGELPAPGAERTVVLYAHYDGQPVDPERWSSAPWEPVLRDAALSAGGREIPLPAAGSRSEPEWRLYARSASDDKGPIVAMMAALDALAAAGIERSVNLKFFFEGEEEAGSPHLEAMLRRHAAALAADAWLFCDGPVHQSRRRQVVFGVRGVTGVEMTVYGPATSLHSGHYGNWAPNPIARLAALLAGMRTPDGEILIAGIGEEVRPLSAAQRRALATVPMPDRELAAALALGTTEGAGAPLAELILRPAVNFKGIASGKVGAESKNAIPTEARASIGFRLVPDQTPEGVRRAFEAHLERQGVHLVSDEPDAATRRAHPVVARLEWGPGYRALATPLDLPVSRAVVAVVDEVAGETVPRVPLLGGSLPLYLFEEVLAAPLIVVPMVNHDNNQHAPDENLRLANLWDGIELYAALMARLGEEW